MLLELLGHEVLLGDVHLLLEGVAGQLQDLHAVAERRGDGIEQVGGGDEHDLREIEGHVEVVVGEAEVLLRVEHLEERRAGIAAEVGPELVDLVEHHGGVVRGRLLHGLDDPARQRTHVGASVTSDLRLVPHAAEAEAHELAAGGPGDRLPERGLAHAGRPDEAEDGAAHVVLQLAHRKVLEDALLDLVEAVVVGVEDLPGVLDVEVVLGPLGPGKVGDPVEVGAGHGVLGAGRGDGLEAVELLVGDLLHVGRETGLLEPFAQLVELLLLLAQLAQLLLDGLELLAQVVLALGLRHLALHGAVDLVGELEDLPLAVEQLEHELHARLEVDGLEDLLLLLDGHVDVGGDEVGEVPGMGDRVDELGGRRGQLRHQLDDLAGQLLQIDGQGLDLDLVDRGLVLDRLDTGLEVRRLLHQVEDADPGEPLDHEGVVVLPHLEELHDPGDGPDGVEVGRAGVFLLGAPLGDHSDDLLVADGVLDERDGLLASHRQGEHAPGEEDRVSQGQDGENLGDVLLVDEGRWPHGRCDLGASTLLLLFRHDVLLLPQGIRRDHDGRI